MNRYGVSEHLFHLWTGLRLSNWEYIELACLRHLHELKADGNKITNLEGLERMDGLVKLSLHGNMISSINCRQFKWFVGPVLPHRLTQEIIFRTRLEMLNVSHNRLDNVEGLGLLQSLIALNMGM